ncbi:hypothetical protein V6N13_040228 [Hibiscus sabdariffa]|uniref:Uncharacterized protein n=1 Tax=Hibiscus sabdariffa TaxID=183260 RepID=A0ABR2ST22_9ROSI
MLPAKLPGDISLVPGAERLWNFNWGTCEHEVSSGSSRHIATDAAANSSTESAPVGSNSIAWNTNGVEFQPSPNAQ